MNSRLVVGLGNAAVDSDRVGIDVIQDLRQIEEFRETVDFLEGGTDLLRLHEQLRNRQLIIFVDAVSGARSAGVLVREHGAADLSDAQFGAHHLSAIQSLDLLRWADPSIAAARCVWVLVSLPQEPNA